MGHDNHCCRLLRQALLAALIGTASCAAVAASVPEDLELLQKNILGGREDAFEEKEWAEAESQLPPAPVDGDLVPIDVGSRTENRFAVDVQSVTYGADDVIRYTLVITSSGGVRNVTYEGMRCETAERRVYAFGRRDGSWSKARKSEWVRIVDNNLNRHHAALFKDYFCTTGGSVSDTAGARRVLATGNPAAIAR
ncbi:MAG: CNP1-like family protein [Rhodocyclaceae bacterium]|nr:CNP1-like family protein [Rhodocyclaceae bacterium]